MAIYNIETTRANRRKMNLVCGGINAATLLVFLVGTCGLYVIDGHGDEREAGGIDEDVDDRPENVVGSTESESHLYHILYRQSYHGENDHPAGTLIPLVHPSYIQMREYHEDGIDEHEYETCKLK